METGNLRDRLSAILAAADHEEPDADVLYELAYQELRTLAHRTLDREQTGHSLQTTALVHEAYLRLVDDRGVTAKGRAYFFGAAARAMRQVLVDRARRRTAEKRGGGDRVITLDEQDSAVTAFADELLDLNDALSRLESAHPRAARVVECRFFGGLEVEEIARILEVSPRTVKSDWAFARAWLHRALYRKTPP
ncbi:MAG TPA: sigma-70 family RNA polymerase sigma factor [Gemmatimonadaceae bacterium]